MKVYTLSESPGNTEKPLLGFQLVDEQTGLPVGRVQMTVGQMRELKKLADELIAEWECIATPVPGYQPQGVAALCHVELKVKVSERA